MNAQTVKQKKLCSERNVLSKSEQAPRPVMDQLSSTWGRRAKLSRSRQDVHDSYGVVGVKVVTRTAKKEAWKGEVFRESTSAVRRLDDGYLAEQ